MSKRLPLKNNDEFDIMRGWRRWYVWTKRPGACKAVKTRINRRERRHGKAEAHGAW